MEKFIAARYRLQFSQTFYHSLQTDNAGLKTLDQMFSQRERISGISSTLTADIDWYPGNLIDWLGGNKSSICSPLDDKPRRV